MASHGRTAGLLATALVAVVAVGEASDAGAAAETTGEPLRVMTFNIRFDNPGDGEDAWPLRREKAASMVRFHGADVVGLQEALRR
jgi:endonuclease/exonuclease/phosphatase family metal-dependent hydrolase